MPVLTTGSVDYRFVEQAVSTTVDPVTGASADTSTRAVLQPFLLSRTMVTNAQWRAFCDAAGDAYLPSTARTAGQYWSGGSYPAGKEDHPVFFVSYVAAQAYCAWVQSSMPEFQVYVPTEGEWEYAALGGRSGWTYPWGSSAGMRWTSSTGVLETPFNCHALCTAWVLTHDAFATLSYTGDSTVLTLADGVTTLTDDRAPRSSVLSMSASGGVSGWQYDSASNRSWADFANSDAYRELVSVHGGFSSAVGTFPAGRSWCGCDDLAGNAYEWTSTTNLASNGVESGSLVQVVKGGSWYSTASSGRSSGRGEGRAPTGAYHSVGFRIAARRR